MWALCRVFVLGAFGHILPFRGEVLYSAASAIVCGCSRLASQGTVDELIFSALGQGRVGLVSDSVGM